MIITDIDARREERIKDNCWLVVNSPIRSLQIYAERCMVYEIGQRSQEQVKRMELELGLT